MISEQAQLLIDLSLRKVQIHKQVEQLHGFQTREREINGAVERMRSSMTALSAFRARGIASPPVSGQAEPLLERIAEVESNFRQDREWIINQRGFKPQPFFSSLESFESALRSNLSIMWSNYMTERVPHINNELLSVLSKIRDFAATVVKIRRLSSQIERWRPKIPAGEGDFIEFDALIAEVNQAWTELGSDEVPVSVLEFLKAATTGGASLELYTDEVKDWLTKRAISHSFRVRVAD